MSLFIGNVSKKVTSQEFEDAFKSHGNCKIDLRVHILQIRNDMLLFNMTANDALSKPNKLSKMSILVGWGLTFNGQRIQEDLTKTLKEEFQGKKEDGEEVTQETGAGANNRGIWEDLPPMKEGMPLPTLTTRKLLMDLNQNVPEIENSSVD